MSIETEMTTLREAIERLTLAIDRHAANRLALFERAGQEALAAIPPVASEADAATLGHLVANEEDPALAAALAETPLAPRTPVSLAEVQQVASEMMRSGQGPTLKKFLVDEIRVGNIGQLTADQRIDFMDRTLAAGWLPHTQAPEAVQAPVQMAAANQLHDEPPPAEVSPADALAVARRLIETGRGPLVKRVLIDHIHAPNLETLTPAQRVEFVRLVNREAA